MVDTIKEENDLAESKKNGRKQKEWFQLTNHKKFTPVIYEYL